MNNYDKTNKNYIDYKGKFLNKAVKALTDDQGYFKECYHDYFNYNHEPTQEIWDLYYNEGYKYTDDKIKFLEQLK